MRHERICTILLVKTKRLLAGLYPNCAYTSSQTVVSQAVINNRGDRLQVLQTLKTFAENPDSSCDALSSVMIKSTLVIGAINAVPTLPILE